MATYDEHVNPFHDQARDHGNPFHFNDGLEFEMQQSTANAYKTDIERSTASSSTAFSTDKRNGLTFALRVLTLSASIGSFFLIIFSKQTASLPVLYPNNTIGREDLTTKYSYSTTHRFLLYANALVAIYSFCLVLVSFVSWLKRWDVSKPRSLVWPVFVLNMLMGYILLLAFAAGVAVEVLSRKGGKLSGTYDGFESTVNWQAICKYYGRSCAFIESALTTTALAFLSLTLCAVLDAYDIYTLSRS